VRLYPRPRTTSVVLSLSASASAQGRRPVPVSSAREPPQTAFLSCRAKANEAYNGSNSNLAEVV
jgi:hypothetical protein